MENEITGEVAGSPADFAEKTERKPAVKRDAHCLVCSNEWNAINGYAKKPSKCPECHTRKCVWKDELPKTEEKTETSTEKPAGKDAKTQDFAEKTDEKTARKSEKIETDTKPTSESIISQIFSPAKTPEKIEVPDDGKFRPPQGLPLVLVFALLLVLGIVGGAAWFLGRHPKLDTAPPQALQRPPSKAEIAMRRCGGAV